MKEELLIEIMGKLSTDDCLEMLVMITTRLQKEIYSIRTYNDGLARNIIRCYLATCENMKQLQGVNENARELLEGNK